MSIDDTRGRSLARKYQTMASFGTRFWGVRGILPCTEANHTHLSYIDELQILHSMCIPCHCSQRRHLRTTVWQGWMCLSDIPCSRCPRSWLSYSMQECETPGTSTTQHLQLTQFRCRRCRLDDIKGRSLAKKYPKMASFWTRFGGAWASRPARRQITHTNHISMNYKYCIVCACQSMTSPLQSKVPP